MSDVTNISFDNIDKLLNFLLNTSEFNDWETVIFRLSATNGMELNMNTKISDPSGTKRYIEIKKLKTLLNQFYEQNSYINVNLEIKLKFPDSLQKAMDPTSSYSKFYVDFYSDDITSFVHITFVENSKVLSVDPIQNWVTYIMNLYNVWYNKQ